MAGMGTGLAPWRAVTQDTVEISDDFDWYGVEQAQRGWLKEDDR